MKRDQDNIIDWSAFEEVRTPKIVGTGAMLLRVLAVVLFIEAIVGIVLGAMNCMQSLTALGSHDILVAYAAQGPFVSSVVTLLLSAATLVPACFTLQAASQPDKAFSTIVFGICGILTCGGCMAFGILEQGVPLDIMWIVFSILSIAHLALSIVVRWVLRPVGGTHASKTDKEKIWDEEEIWKQE